MICKRVLVLVLTVLVLTPATAVKADLNLPDLEALALSPAARAQIDKVLPSKPGDTFVVLQNGMVVLVRENHASRVVSCRVLVRTGSIYEEEHLGGGLSHYLEHVVAGGTTKSFTEDEAKEVLQELGGASNAYTSYDRTVYFIDTTGDHYLKAIRLLLAYVSECVFAEKEVEREKAVIQQEFKLGQTNVGQQLWQLFMRTAYLRHPVRHPVIGYEQAFVQVSRNDLLDYYRRRYLPQNLVVAIVGDVDTSEALARVIELAASMPRGFDQPVALPLEPEQNAPRWAELLFPPARTTSMMVGYPSVRLAHPDLYALDLLSLILGRGRSSRLYRELKDRLGLVTAVDSFSYTPAAVRGVFGFSFTLERENVDSVLAALRQQLDRVQRRLVSRQELKRAKRQILADAVNSRLTASQVAASLSSSLADTGDPYFDDHYVEQIQKVAREDIRRVARAYLRPQARTVAILSPPRPGKTASTQRRQQGEVERYRLDNGLTVLLKRDNRAPVVSVQLFGLGGQRLEPPEYPGISSFTMSMLTKGTDSLSKEKLAARIEGMGGSLQAGAGRNTYYATVSVLKDDLEAAMSLLADVLRHPAFPAAEIEKQRRDTLVTLKRLDEDWQAEVERLFRRRFYRDHPYGRDLLGTKDSIARLDRDHIKEFYQQTVMPNTAVLAIFGDIDLQAARKLVRKAFGSWKARKPPPAPAARIPPLEVSMRLKVKTKQISAGIFLGTPGLAITDPDRPVLDVIDAALSGIGYPGGRLHEALRGGNRNLVYVVHAFPSYGIDGGHFGIITQTTMANYKQVVDIILDNLERIRRQTLSPKELLGAKNMCITMHEMGLDTPAAQARSAAINELLGLGHDWDQRYPGLVRAVSAEDVLRVATRLFRHYLMVSTIPEHPVEALSPPQTASDQHRK